MQTLPMDLPSRQWNPTAKAFLTLGIAALYIVGREIPLPTIIAHVGRNHNLGGAESIMALGFEPLISGFVLVELAALLVPEWRPLRAGAMASRSQLRRASLIVGMLLTFGQAVVMVLGYEKWGMTVTSALVTIVIFLGATAALIVLTWFVDREGLGSGFTALLLGAAILWISRAIGKGVTAVQFGTLPLSALFTETFGSALLVLMTLFFFSRYCLPETLPHAAMISRPACGVIPLITVPNVVIFALFFFSMIQPDHVFTYEQFVTPPGFLVLCVIAAVVFAFLFNRPDRVAAAWNALSPNPPEGIPRLKAVMVESVLFIALAVIVQEWLFRQLGRAYVPPAATVILATAIACDLVHEWRARNANTSLTSIWEIHQPYAVVPAMRLLEDEGLHPFARGLHLRSLLQFFGPYVPIEIFVPANEAQTAHALLQERWPGSHTIAKREGEAPVEP